MKTRIASFSARFALGLAMWLGLLATDVRPASAALLCYVKADAAGLNNGTSWGNAFNSLQSALGGSPCTEVWVARGMYKPTSGTDRTLSFVLKNGVALYGGFAGNETLLSQRMPAANPTILSGEIGAAGKADNSYHVVVGSSTDRTARLDGFIVTAGNANGSTYPDIIGGGMYDHQGSPSLANVTFSGNSANEGGGGMTNEQGSPSLVNMTFSGNSAGFGGGLYNVESDPVVTNATFSANSANSWAGGGIFNDASNPILTNVTFSSNLAPSSGGIYNYSTSSPTITNSILYGDTAGEIGKDQGSPIVRYSIVQGGYPGTGNLNVNPLLKPLGFYGGFTRTMPLSYGSPAIDHGTNIGCLATDQRGIPRPQDGDGNGTATCDMGATESRLLAKSFQSIGAQDGWVLESTETSSVGGSLNATAETLSVGDSTLRQQGLSILSFNTSSLPDTSTIRSAVLKIKKAGLAGVDPFSTHGNLLADVRKGTFSNNAALQLTDFQALASKNAAITILNNPVNGWYSRAMPAANLVYINKLGLTQFRLRFQLDDDNDSVADYLKFYSGNAALASVRPLLIVKYYLP